MKDRATLYTYANGESFQGMTVQETFQKIFEEGAWNEITDDSLSGEGSSLEQTRELIDQLPGILRDLGVKSMLDLPCGDFNWMKFVDLEGIQYIGGDIVVSLIQNNRERFESPNRQFGVIDILQDDLPESDLVFSRDCLVHFSFDQVKQAVENVKRSGARFFMTTHFTQQEENKDIVTGGWRPLNMQKAPFNFPEPMLLLDEKCTEMNGAFSDKMLALWRVEDL